MPEDKNEKEVEVKKIKMVGEWLVKLNVTEKNNNKKILTREEFLE